MSSITYPLSQLPAPGEALEIVPGVKWVRMSLPFDLDHINLYLLEDHDGWLIIDTAMDNEKTRADWQKILSAELGGKPVKAVLCTHHHPDHIGLAGWLTESWKAPLMMSREEHRWTYSYVGTEFQENIESFLEFYQRAGVPAGGLQKMQEHFKTWENWGESLPLDFQVLQDGESLLIKGHNWQIIMGAGHSPEHVCLYCEDLQILISGDQVLPVISPNVSLSPLDPEGDPLDSWLKSLQKLKKLPADLLVLPAHNQPFRGLPARAEFLIAGHEEQMKKLEKACLKAQTAFELVPVLFNRELGPMDLLLALGECLAHLQCLVMRQGLKRFVNEDGVDLYQSNLCES